MCCLFESLIIEIITVHSYIELKVNIYRAKTEREYFGNYDNEGGGETVGWQSEF